ncbi:Holliday junction ATP-dependent DNA helicase RuvA [Planktothrix tepida]|uniref:Holliday junction branch migration complex subunit RuvA n=1 Tax=Planktothrix tepida PCC 9214 TaxID=671072 RepID=A0A1J1LVH6_9CYAN|nr:Holliday junction branch migration protein RuvA [Planktothrix tepida]CAD5978667.1 Holliday junction ATP-dependent DNA helicase RuvA [Planktothrix tepida]CUR36114.1 Holliday junction ATP-dependent DNA helicase RuvA [Planktothrix tepida PCC 9214]
MIGSLTGIIADIQKGNANRVTLLLNVNNVGYELQILPRMRMELPPLGETTQIFTHLQVREDQMVLYGFSSMAERDLFRQLISVSGIGTQLAIALLDTLGLQDLIQAIVGGNTRVLAKTPGVGNKTAERIALELKTKLSEWRNQAGLLSSPSGIAPHIQEEVEMTLLALGYTGAEVMQALQAISQDSSLVKQTNSDEWIRSAIAWLSQGT